MMRSLLLSTFVAAAVALGSAPNPSKQLEVFTINLDLAPEDRFTEVIKSRKTDMKVLLEVVRLMFLSKKNVNTTDALLTAADAGMKDEYRREMQGIATTGGFNYTDILMANLFYEIDKSTPESSFKLPWQHNQSAPRSCTSIVAQCSNGTVLLARNQDYPPPFSVLQFHGVFTRGGKKVYEGTMFAGVLGLATALRTNPGEGGSWAVSINARTNPAKGTAEGLERITQAAKAGAATLLNMVRDTMEGDGIGDSYQAALAHVRSAPLMLPGYLIIGGSTPGEGAIVTRNGSDTTATDTDVYELFAEGKDGKPSLAGGTWFVVQTNSDRWETHKEHPDFPVISRRGTAVKKLEEKGEDSLDLLALWDVLSTFPVENPATIHRELVAPVLGEYQTYKVHGPI